MGEMAMFGMSFYDLITSTIGAYLYMIIWDLLKMSGFVFLAFIAFLIGALKENYESDELNDEPHQQTARVTVRLVLMIIVLLFVATPTITINDLKLRVPSRQCSVFPTVTSTEMNLQDDERAILNQYGSKELVTQLIDKERQASGKRLSHTDAANNVANRIFTGKLAKEYQRLSSGYSYGSRMPASMRLATVITEARGNERQAKALDDLGIRLEGIGRDIRVPVWWQLWRNYLLGVNASVHSVLPCDSGVRIVKSQMETDFISDQELKKDFLDFYEQCHTPALVEWRNKSEAARRGLYSERVGSISAVSIPGNPIFLADYYPNLKSSIPVAGFGDVESEKGFDGDADALGSSRPAVPEGMGYPDCDQWWTNPEVGLEKELISYYALDTDEGQLAAQRQFNIDTDSSTDILQSTLAYKMHSGNTASVTAAKEIMSRIQGGYMTKHDTTAESNSLGQSMLGLAVDFGIVTSYLERLSGLKALLAAMPMATSLLVMFFTAMIPIGLVIGRFDLMAVVGITMTYVSIMLWFPYFRMVKWVDDNLVSIFALSSASPDKMMIDIMIGSAYIAVPMLMTSMVTLAGVKIATLDPVGGATMGSIGQGGMKTLTNIGKMLGTKGKNLMGG